MHELLWYLSEAETLCTERSLHRDVRVAIGDIGRLSRATADELAALDVDAVRDGANRLLSRVSDLVRVGAPGRRADHRGADLIGATFRGGDLRGANLRGAYLIGADLRGAGLGLADVTGADFRTADLRAADLSTTIFLLQSQLDAARGDDATRVRPAHWAAG